MKKTVFAIFALMIGMVLMSSQCQKDEQVISTNNPVQLTASFDESEFYIPTVDEEFDLSGLSLDEGIQFTPDRRPPHDGRKNRPDMNDRRKHDRKHGFLLGRVLHSMDLTEDQLTQIREFFKQHHDCMRRVMEASKQAREEIFKRARAARMEIITALRNGEITPVEAREKMEALKLHIREALHNSVDWELRCKCIWELFRNIASILDEEQLAIWQRYIASLEGPCFGEDDNTDDSEGR